MRPIVISIVAGIAAVGAVSGGAVFWRAAGERAALERVAAFRSAMNASSVSGWVQTFDDADGAALTERDARWQPLFGTLRFDARRRALIGDPAGGWDVDRGDDYAFRLDRPMASAELVVDGWWDGEGAIGVQGAVQANAPHRLYEATLWRGRLGLIYFEGPEPSDFEYLAESENEPVRKGHYRLVLRMEREDSVWQLTATLQDPRAGYRTIAQVTARDARLDAGGQGVGILGKGASSYITGIAVREL